MRKTGFYGTEEIFGTGNALLRYGMHLQRPAEQPNSPDCGQPPGVRDAFSGAPVHENPLLTHATRFQGRAVPKAAPAAPDASSVRGTAPALFVRSGPFHHFLRPANAELASGGPFPCSFDGTRYQKRPRSEVSRHKKGMTSKSVKTFLVIPSIKLSDLIISPEIWLPAPLQDVR